MAQFKVYGRDTFLRGVRSELSDVLHAAAVTCCSCRPPSASTASSP
ncbi:MAG: hypothetical protein PGN11_20815 [Quadrisphaera sp.]